jgi:hypothetical protein
VVNRKLVVVVVIAAVLALLAGAAVGRSLLSPGETSGTRTAEVVRFKDPASKISIAYPSTWKRQPDRPQDPDLVLLAAARDGSASLLVRVTPSGLDAPVTQAVLPIVKKYTDSLLSSDQRAKQLVDPVAVGVGGLPGWRYRYTFGDGATGGAHDHYFLFKEGKLVQLVFQAVPAKRLPAVAPTFDSIAASFRGRDA